jgi:hypothetical protein
MDDVRMLTRTFFAMVVNSTRAVRLREHYCQSH